MSALLEKTDEITLEDLESEIRAYEQIYGITTAQLFEMIARHDPGLERIEDAGFWRMNAEALERLQTMPRQPEMKDEDPKRVLVHFVTTRFR